MRKQIVDACLRRCLHTEAVMKKSFQEYGCVSSIKSYGSNAMSCCLKLDTEVFFTCSDYLPLVQKIAPTIAN